MSQNIIEEVYSVYDSLDDLVVEWFERLRNKNLLPYLMRIYSDFHKEQSNWRTIRRFLSHMETLMYEIQQVSNPIYDSLYDKLSRSYEELFHLMEELDEYEPSEQKRFEKTDDFQVRNLRDNVVFSLMNKEVFNDSYDVHLLTLYVDLYRDLKGFGRRSDPIPSDPQNVDRYNRRIEDIRVYLNQRGLDKNVIQYL